MGARRGHKHEMRVRVSECGGDLARAGMGAELWLEAFREMLLPGKARTPGAVPPTAGSGVGGVGEVMEDSILSVLRASQDRQEGERSGEVSKSYFRGVPSK